MDFPANASSQSLRQTRSALTYYIDAGLDVDWVTIKGWQIPYISNAVSLFLPVVSRISSRSGLSMSRLLMPMGFTAILGDTMTMVGSSPLILLDDEPFIRQLEVVTGLRLMSQKPGPKG